MFDRRELLRRAAALGLGAGLLPLAGAGPARAEEEPHVRRRVKLGRTGLELPDIGFGASSLAGDEALVHFALDRGITHFDSAEGYRGGASEETLGRALRGRRDEVTLVSKTITRAGTPRDAIMRDLEGSLARLQTDYVDIYMCHAVNDPDRITSDEWNEFVALAKQQGKIRFSGMSGHGGRLVTCLDAALDADNVDVVLVGYNFGQDPGFLQQFTSRLDFVAVQPDLPGVLARAHAQDVGVIAMKTLRGARLNDMRPYEGAGATFAQAALRWTLSNPDVDSLIVTMKSPEQVDEYLGASGWTQAHAADAGLLSRYARAAERTQCRYGCADCAGACPAGVSIPDALRGRMYADDYGDAELARGAFADAGNLSACLSCSGEPCATACPHGVEISRGTQRAASLL